MNHFLQGIMRPETYNSVAQSKVVFKTLGCARNGAKLSFEILTISFTKSKFKFAFFVIFFKSAILNFMNRLRLIWMGSVKSFAASPRLECWNDFKIRKGYVQQKYFFLRFFFIVCTQKRKHELWTELWQHEGRHKGRNYACAWCHLTDS